MRLIVQSISIVNSELEHNMESKRVGIGEICVRQGEALLSANGVGSCIVIILYESEKRVGGLAHCLLPTGDNESFKYPKGAIKGMLQRMEKMGADMKQIVAKLVGGASMFSGFKGQKIGERNVIETRRELNDLGIPIVAEDVFGNWGRTIFFNVNNGEVRVRSFQHGEKVL